MPPGTSPPGVEFFSLRRPHQSSASAVVFRNIAPTVSTTNRVICEPHHSSIRRAPRRVLENFRCLGLSMAVVRESIVALVVAAVLLAVPLAQTSVDDNDVQSSTAIVVLRSSFLRGHSTRVLRPGHESSQLPGPGWKTIPLSSTSGWYSRLIAAVSSPEPIRLELRC